VTELRTEKQEAIAAALRQSPNLNDREIAEKIGASRGLVRRIRLRIENGNGQPQAEGKNRRRAPEPAGRTAPWRPTLDRVFGDGGVADELESYVEAFVRLGGQLDQVLAQLEINARTHHLRHDRHRLVRAIYNLARELQRNLVPVGPCPFCDAGNGCSRCTGGGWANETTVDAGALLEAIHAKARWWRPHRVQVPV